MLKSEDVLQYQRTITKVNLNTGIYHCLQDVASHLIPTSIPCTLFILNTGLLKMIVGVLTTCHTKYI